MTTTPAFTVNDITSAYDDPRWAGWGYLGERRRYVEDSGTAEEVARADAYALAEATRRGWTAENLFAWLNSRPGRHFADAFWGVGSIRAEHVDSYFPTLTEDPA